MGSSKPCPGCGEVRQHRKATELCGQCQNEIRSGRLYLSQTEDLHLEVVNCPKRHYQFPSNYREFNDRFGELIEAIGIKVERGHRFSGRGVTPYAGRMGTINCGENYLFMPEGVGEALKNLFESVISETKKAEKKGFESGKSILGNLASGELSMKDFNDRTIR